MGGRRKDDKGRWIDAKGHVRWKEDRREIKKGGRQWKRRRTWEGRVNIVFCDNMTFCMYMHPLWSAENTCTTTSKGRVDYNRTG